MSFDGELGNKKLGGNLPIGFSLLHQRKDFALPQGKRIKT